MRLYGMVLGEDIEGETNALPCVLLIRDGASLPRCGEVRKLEGEMTRVMKCPRVKQPPV